MAGIQSGDRLECLVSELGHDDISEKSVRCNINVMDWYRLEVVQSLRITSTEPGSSKEEEEAQHEEDGNRKERDKAAGGAERNHNERRLSQHRTIVLWLWLR